MTLSLSASSLYLEARDEYLDLRKQLSVVDAVDAFMKAMESEMKEDTDRCFCIAGLAKAQAQRRELTQPIVDELDRALKEIASQYAKDGYMLSGRDISYFAKRVKDPAFFASESEARIAPKPVRQRGYRCKWATGDTFAFQLNSQAAEEAGIAGRYCVIRKIDQEEKDRFGLASTFPIVYLTLHDSLDITDQVSLENAGYLIVWDRYFKRKGKYEYRIAIRIESQRKLDDFGLIYLGYYPEARIPGDEIRMIHWPVPLPSRSGCTPPPEVKLSELEDEVCELYLQYGIAHPDLVPFDAPIEEK